MVRKILLAVISLAIIIVVYLFYVLSVDSAAIQEPVVVTQPAVVSTTGPTTRAVVGVGPDQQPIYMEPGEKTYFEVYSRQGRLLYQFRSEHWRPIDEDVYELEKPELRLFMRHGQIVQISSAEGTIVARRVRNRLEPVRGTLRGKEGKVHVVIDRGTDPNRGELELRNQDMIHIYMDQLDFDLDSSEIKADGQIVIESDELDMLGRGLHISWSQATNQIERLVLLEGEKLTIRREVDMVQLGLPGSAVADDQADQVANQPSYLAQLLRTGDQAIASSQPARQSASDTPVVPASSPATDRAPASSRSYRLTFHDNIRVMQYDQLKLVGTMTCRQMYVDFDLPKTTRNRAEDAATSQPSTKPVEPQDRPIPSKRLEVFWDGPMEMLPRPARPTIKPRFHIIAVGQPVRIEQIGQGVAVCDNLTYKQESKQLWLEGTGPAPVRITQGQAREVVCTKLMYDQLNDAFLGFGPGFMQERPGKGAQAQQLGLVKLSADQSQETTVLWEQGFELKFDQYRVLTVQGFVQRQYLKRANFTGNARMQRRGESMRGDNITLHFDPPSFDGQTDPKISRVQVTGNVELDSDNQQITCDSLDVQMSSQGSDNPVPQTIHARGDVEARQGRRLIKAQELIVQMAQQEPEPAETQAAKATVATAIDAAAVITGISAKTAGAKTSGKKDRGILIRSVQARGDVQVRDPVQKLEIDCQALDVRVSPEDRKLTWVLLEGKSDNWARCLVGDEYRISGARVELDLLKQTADVPGPGKLLLMDLPDPVDILWQDSMHMEGGSVNRGHFQGKVQAISEKSTLYCQTLVVDFQREQLPEPMGSSAPQPAQQQSRFWIFSRIVQGKGQGRQADIKLPEVRRRPVYLHALPDESGMVRIENLQVDQNQIISRLTICGPELQSDLRTGRVNLPGAGYMVIEDYRLPKDDKSARAQLGEQQVMWKNPFGADLSAIGPSQTAFRWTNGLTYRVDKRMAIFDGSVQMKLVAGEHLIPGRRGDAQQSQDRPAEPEPEPERSATLTCDNMVVQFAKGLAGDIGDVQAGAGNLRKVIASGNCRLVEANREVICNRLVYDRSANIIRVYGTDREPAQIYQESTADDPYAIWRGPELIWDRDSGQIEARQTTIITPGR